MKLQKDRKIRRSIDIRLSQQSQVVNIALVGVLVITLVMDRVFLQNPTLYMLLGSIAFLLLSAAFYLNVKLDQIYGAGPANWRRLFFAVSFVMAGYIGMIPAALLYLNVDFESFHISLLALVAVATLSNVAWSPYYRINCIRQACLLIPSIVSFLFLKESLYFIEASGLFILLGLVVRQSKGEYDEFWSKLEAADEIHRKIQDMEFEAEKVRHSSQFKTEFLTSITHEIRTPMNNVLGMLALLDDTPLTEQQRELQKVAVSSGESLLSLIDDVLDFSRISSGQIQLNDTVFNLRKVTDQTLDVLGPRAHNKGIELNCAFDKDIAVRVNGDSSRFSQLLASLVSNAIKYSNGSEILVTVHTVESRDGKALFRVGVRDNGDGVDVNLQKDIFNAFSKKTLSTSDLAQTGAGLGLAIAKGLSECMGGTIGLETWDGSDTEFWYTVKLGLSSQQVQKDSVRKAVKNKPVLVVDSEGGLSKALRVLFESCDMIVDFTESDKLRSVLETSTGSPSGYELIVINLPLLKKVDLQQIGDLYLKGNMNESTRFIVMSSLSQRAEVIRSGMDDKLNIEWLSKPVSQEKLFRALFHCFVSCDENQHSDFHLLDRNAELTGKRILLVEDNAVSQMVAKKMIEKLGYIVSCANNGNEALALMKEQVFDLVLMDCIMPVLDGYDTTEAIRVDESGSDVHIPIVAMTASVVKGEQQRCLSVGMDDYLSKPVNIDELHAKLRQWLGTVKSEVSDGTFESGLDHPNTSQKHASN